LIRLLTTGAEFSGGIPTRFWHANCTESQEQMRHPGGRQPAGGLLKVCNLRQ